MRHIKACAFMLCALCIAVECAAFDIKGHTITTADGLSNNTVRNIVQDEKGFLWFATHNGLNRWDGVRMKCVVPVHDDGVTLADRRVNYVKADRHGRLWVGTMPSRVSCYDLRTQRFVDYSGCGDLRRSLRGVLFVEDDVWLWGEDGCMCIGYDNGKTQPKTFGRKGALLVGGKVHGLVRQGNDVWVMSDKGLYRCDGKRVECVGKSLRAVCGCSVGGKAFFATGGGDVWKFDGMLSKIGSMDCAGSAWNITGELVDGSEWRLFTTTGGYTLDMATGRLRRSSKDCDIKNAIVTIDNHGDYWLNNGTGMVAHVERSSGKMRRFRLMDEKVLRTVDQERYHFVQDDKGLLWMATYGNGLFVYDTKKNELRQYRSDKHGTGAIVSDYLLSLFLDRAGNVWAGSWQEGVTMITTSESGTYEALPTRAQVRMLVKDGHTVWVGATDGQLMRSDGELKTIQTVPNDGGNIYSVLTASDGTTWIGSRTNGLCIGGKWYRNSPKDQQSLGNNAVYAIGQDNSNRVWAATFGGGLNLAVNNGKGGWTFRRFLTENKNMAHVRCIAKDGNGWMWCGTSDGLVVFNPKRIIKNPKDYYKYTVDNHKLRSNEVRCIMKDRDGNMWVAETGEGFTIFQVTKDYTHMKARHFGVKDGLTNTMVQAFAQDGERRVWVSTEYGICRFDAKSATFHNYYFAPTMAGNTYSENCLKTLDDGRIVGGTMEGLALIDPRLVNKRGGRTGVVFTDITLGGTSMECTDAHFGLGEALPYKQEITLEHDQNSFAVHFSTMTYATESPTLYSYKLEGYDEEWSAPSTLSFAAYKQLPAGTYRLHVRATGEDGNWANSDNTLTIDIDHAPWASPTAYVIYSILFAFGAYVAVRAFRKIHRLRTQVLVEEQMSEYKLNFYTNVSHEFRTPLTLIQAALERMSQSQPDEQHVAMAMMQKSTRRMLRLVDELLEFRKAEKGKLTLALEQTEMAQFVTAECALFADNAKSRGITYNVSVEPQPYTMPLDRGKADKIICNLLSNALKYTPRGGIVTVSAKAQGQTYTITVTDTGVGIPADKRKQIFTRYATNNASRNSMGIGLHLVSELVAAHKGTINYAPNPEGGSIFMVTLPATHEVYSQSDFLASDHLLLDADTIGSASTMQQEISLDADSQDIQPMNDRTILVVEDDDDVRQLIVRELKPYANVVARADGADGLEHANANDVDLILCDVMMPQLNGFELTQRIKNTFATSHIPVVLLTALSAEESQLKGAQCGADAYITKPFSTRLLLTRVFKLIEQREKLKEKFTQDVTAVRPLISTNDADKAFADQLMEVVTKNMDNSDFTVDDFAAAMHIGRTILYRKVKGVTGYAPKEYLRVIRMKKAAELLLRSDMNVSDVAYAVGMTDPLYFSKTFRQQFGVSPTEYVKNAMRNA